MSRAVLAVVALAKHASVGWPELDKSAKPLRNPLEKSAAHIPQSLTQNILATMVFPDPYPSPPESYAFSPVPDAPNEDDLMAQWAQHAGYVRPEPVEGSNFDFEGLDALLAWELGDALPEPTSASQLGGGLDFDWTAIMARDIAGKSATFDHLAAAPVAATAPMSGPPFAANTDYINDFLFSLPEWGSTLSLTPELTDVSSFTSPQSDSTGDQRLPSPTYEAAASQFVPSSAIPLPNIAFTDVFQQEQATCTPPSWFIGDGIDYGNTHVETNLDVVTPVDMSSTTVNTSTGGVGVLEMVLGKRRRKSSYELPQQRVNPITDGVLEAAGSTKRTRRTPAIRTQLTINDKSKAAGRGVGRLASTTARGVYHRSLLGPSVPQGSVGALMQGRPSWTEEREEMRHDTQQIDQRDPEIAEDPEGPRAIPKTLTVWQRLLFQATQADVERGVVSMIKCRLCPTERFKTWACFYRHCRDCEEHPADIKCCERCGIYFGRQDSMKRHNDSATKACCETAPGEAAWRKYKAMQLLSAFQARVEYCLRTGEELGPKFATIARAELPSRSKKAFSSRRNKLAGNSSQVAGL
ncbi:hypothetical protein EDB89DRAFT_77647 [Lactarius sanguifluus]|nr:hypothetical protein EDB89DRAFT_77647 [Lactarius sanguifluus]